MHTVKQNGDVIALCREDVYQESWQQPDVLVNATSWSDLTSMVNVGLIRLVMNNNNNNDDGEGTTEGV